MNKIQIKFSARAQFCPLTLYYYNILFTFFKARNEKIFHNCYFLLLFTKNRRKIVEIYTLLTKRKQKAAKNRYIFALVNIIVKNMRVNLDKK